MKPLHFAAAALFGLGCSALSINAKAQDYCVSLGNDSSICGTTHTLSADSTYSVFKGIQYATADRWTPSEIVTSYAPKTPATEFGAICPQLDYPSKKGGSQDEQCLYLNIWTPKTTEASKETYPVMVFIHGGGFISGSSNAAYPVPDQPNKLLYDGTTFAAEQNVILVTLNYRLGALGFMQLSPNGRSEVQFGGNYGLQDQTVALEWVRNNIEAFGGDKDKVTLFGESAGAMSTGLHLLSTDTAQDTFHAAIMESNPIGYIYRTAEEGHEQAQRFLDCLYAVYEKIEFCPQTTKSTLPDDVTTEEIIAAQLRYADIRTAPTRLFIGLPSALPFAPIVDGSFVKSQPSTKIRAGSPKPLIFGFNKDEGVYFANLAGTSLSTEEYTFLVSDFFKCPFECFATTSHKKGPLKKGILVTDRYNPTHRFTPDQKSGLPNDIDTALSDLINDFTFSCSNMAANQEKKQETIWAYYFTQVDAIQDLSRFHPPLNNVCAPKNKWDNSCHAAELPFVFKSLPSTSSTSDQNLATEMNTAWANFAKSNNPSTKSKKWTSWSKVTSDAPALNILSSASHLQSGNLFEDRHCSSWLTYWHPRKHNYNTALQVIQESMR
ncbi:carboxylesterase family protein [Pseudovibrio denitrificans]|uniref:carboxylesterase family protein n=1 Tax=Pseudovibrio denitrificans TaxID=258256 RepID=UPI0039BF7115